MALPVFAPVAPAAPAIAAYVNTITAGAPMSLVLLESVFVTAVSSVIDASTLSQLDFAVFINGVATSPAGQLIIGDPESYFSATSSGITVTQG
jgi:hypothetical protein